MKNLFKLLLLLFFLLNITNVISQDTFSRIYLNNIQDQIQFNVPNQNRYWLMSKTETDNKALALYSPDDGGWFTYWKKTSGDMVINKGNLGIGTVPESNINLDIMNSSPRFRLRTPTNNVIALGDFGGGTDGQLFIYNSSGEVKVKINGESESGYNFINSGNVGIGETNPISLLQIAGQTRIKANTQYPFIIEDESGKNHFVLDITNDKIYLGDDNDNPTMVIDGVSNGNVLIGKISQLNPAYKLDVAGSIRADEIKVNTTGADFVFEPDYELKSLHEVETFIKENKHLPEIDPASEMEAEGANLGELNTKLLQKIEELTLYMIDINKEVEKLKKENELLKKKMNLEE